MHSFARAKNEVLKLLYGGGSARQLAFVTNTYSLLAFLSLMIFGLQHVAAAGSNPPLGQLEIMGGLTVALNALALRLTRNLSLAQNNLLLIMLDLLIVMLVTGGLNGTGVFWFFMFPVSAFFLRGTRGGLLWMAALFAAVLAVLLLNWAGFLAMPYSPLVIRQLLITLVVVSIGIYAYQHARDHLHAETVKSRQVSEEEKIKSETIIENIDEGLVALDKAGRVVAVNESAETMLGWRKQELMGKKFVELVPMLDQNERPIAPQDRPLQLALNKPDAINARVLYTRKNGDPLPVAVTSKSVILNGEVRGAIGTFRDISEEQAVERAKTEFVTLASHQLRTPVSAIKWYSELLLSDDAGKLNDQQSEYVQQIYGSNMRLVTMLDAMLTASDLELGNLTVRPEPTDLAQLTKLQLIDLMHMQPSKRQLKITEQYSPHLPESMSLDVSLIKTILRTVLGNAIKYTPDGGRISISIQPDQTRLSLASHGSVRIAITDTGYGIPGKEQKNIFVKLFRATNIKERDTDGTGLALYVTKELLSQVGGRISFTSKEGKGSTFVILLPLEGMASKQQMNKPPAAQSTTHPSRKERPSHV